VADGEDLVAVAAGEAALHVNEAALLERIAELEVHCSRDT